MVRGLGFRIASMLAMGLVMGLVSGCFLSRSETREWKEIAQRLEQYNKQAASIIRDAIAGNIKATEAAKSLELLFQSQNRDLDRRVELAEIRTRNFWAAMTTFMTMAGSFLSWLATRYSWAKPFAAVVRSVQKAKSVLPQDLREKFNGAMHDEQKGISGLEMLVQTFKTTLTK